VFLIYLQKNPRPSTNKFTKNSASTPKLKLNFD